jgi:hypothetical protein
MRYLKKASRSAEGEDAEITAAVSKILQDVESGGEQAARCRPIKRTGASIALAKKYQADQIFFLIRLVQAEGHRDRLVHMVQADKAK